MIFGRPFGGEVVKMKDLNLDMYRVVVAGKVFAVNHKELKKRNAWVVSFDVTDYTSSVRINQFMENDKAKPIFNRYFPRHVGQNSRQNDLRPVRQRNGHAAETRL